MLYVHPDTCFGGLHNRHDEVVFKDTDNEDFRLELPVGRVLDYLLGQHIMPQSVVGLFVAGSTLLVTPVHQVELQVLKQLTNPHFFIGDKCGKKGASAYKSYGLYNFIGEEVDLFFTNECKGRNIARLLLESCGESIDKGTGDWRLETTTNYIAVCVDNTSYQTVFLRFDIESYSKLTRAFMKYKMLNLREVAPKTYVYEIPSR